VAGWVAGGRGCWDARCLFERFTQGARDVIADADAQAKALGHEQVGSEHFVLALVRSNESRAGEILRARGVSEDPFRARLLERVPAGESEPPAGSRKPFTPRAKKVLEFSLREALALGTDSIATEHMLLAIAGEPDHFASQLLTEGWGLSPQEIRGAVIESLPSPELIPAERGVPVPQLQNAPSSVACRVDPSPSVRRLLMTAAAGALDDGRTQIDVDDIWLALTRDGTGNRLASLLGIDEVAVRAAMRRRDAAAEPPEASAGG
jgi:ATP-dependent Clp protease ATP-binding subunit ClpC